MGKYKRNTKSHNRQIIKNREATEETELANRRNSETNRGEKDLKRQRKDDNKEQNRYKRIN